MAGKNVQIPIPSLRAEQCSENFHEVDAHIDGSPEEMRHLLPHLYQRPSSPLNFRTGTDADSMGGPGPANFPGLQDKLGEVVLGSETEHHIFRLRPQLRDHDYCSARREDLQELLPSIEQEDALSSLSSEDHRQDDGGNTGDPPGSLYPTAQECGFPNLPVLRRTCGVEGGGQTGACLVDRGDEEWKSYPGGNPRLDNRVAMPPYWDGEPRQRV